MAVPPSLSIAAAARRYKVGKDQMAEAVRKGQVPTVEIGQMTRVVTSKTDEMFGLTTPIKETV